MSETLLMPLITNILIYLGLYIISFIDNEVTNENLLTMYSSVMLILILYQSELNHVILIIEINFMLGFEVLSLFLFQLDTLLFSFFTFTI